ncbi:Hypothetical predicted protein [Mytilus galloprovincialis]|uniref:DZIP3-like HEPN domain-containing protein n=1 Tax=Mytilus galloprovincialis TaxID=29158 RepID=A0A8B6GFB8_MYTGA|nr:Hypothetical predicted protein [Mytilus galloprovincialis]
MSTNEERNYLRLQLFSIDLSTEVVRDYAKRNLLVKHSTFKIFLQANQHDIYHIWSPGIECCKCVSAGPGKCKYGRFSQGQFEKLYDLSGTVKGKHIKRVKGGKVIQTCCCNIISVKDCSIDDIDISTVCPLLLTFGNNSPQHINWITEIKAVRNELCHAPATKSFDDIEFNAKWGRLETAVFGIATNAQSSGLVKHMLKRLLNQMKTEDLSTAQLHTLNDELKLDIKQMITEQSSVQNTALQSISEDMHTVISKLGELSFNFKFGRSITNVAGEKQEGCGNDREGNTFILKLTVSTTNFDYPVAVNKIQDEISAINEKNDTFNIVNVERGCIVITACFKELTVSHSIDEFKDTLQDFLKAIIKASGLQYRKAEIEVKVSFPQRDRYPDEEKRTRKRKHDNSKEESERSTKSRKSPIMESYLEGNAVDSFEKEIQQLLQTHYEQGAENIDIVSHILLKKEHNWDKLTSQEENETITPTLHLVNAANNSFEYAIQMFAALEEPVEQSLDQVRSEEAKLLSEFYLIKQQLEDERKSLSKSERSLNHACNILKETNTKLDEAKMQHQRHLDKKKKGVIGVRLPIVDFIKDKVSGINTSISHVQDQLVNLEQTANEANTNVQNLEREHEAFQDQVISLTNTKTKLGRRMQTENKKIENLECIKEYLKKVDQILSNCSEMEYMKVLLHVFSGMPNPEYNIDSKDPDYNRIKSMLPEEGSVHLHSALGYQGYMIFIMPSGKTKIKERSSMIEIPRGYNPDLENLLFNKGEFDEDLRKLVYGDQDARSEFDQQSMRHLHRDI